VTGRYEHQRFTAAQAMVDGDVARSAALTLCDRAVDAADARLLLEACGLVPYRRGDFTGYSYGRERSAKS
jgi:hypothetical protein